MHSPTSATAAVTPGVTTTEKINPDGSKTTTTVTIREDGSKSTKRKTIRSKKPAQAARSKSPARTTAGVSMKEAFEEALAEDAGGHNDDEVFEKAVRRCIPSEFVLVASQDDLSEAQEAHDAANLFDLPNTKGNAGSLATSALLQLLYKHPGMAVGDTSSSSGKPMSCLKVLQEMHARMKKATKLDVNPQISSSRPLGPPRLGRNTYTPFHIVPPGYTGKRRALLVGIRFVDDIESKQLEGPHNDVHNLQQYLLTHCGFEKQDMLVLKDDGEHTAPTKQNIMDSFQNMVNTSQPGDVVFIQYSGHGGRIKDTSGDEGEDGYDSYILPSDYKAVGQILDDDILKDFIKAMPKGVHTTMLVDACNSGSVGDLPYFIKANTQRDQVIENYFDTDTRSEILEKEAQAGRDKEAYKRAKAERKMQRELRKKQQDEEYAVAKETAGRDAQTVVRQVGRSKSPAPRAPSPRRVQHTPAPTMSAAPTIENFTIKNESEAVALAEQFGTELTLTPEQKACLHQGGTVALSISVQQPVAQPPMQMVSGGMVMMTLEEAAAFKKVNGGVVMMSPEQAAAWQKAHQKQ